MRWPLGPPEPLRSLRRLPLLGTAVAAVATACGRPPARPAAEPAARADTAGVRLIASGGLRLAVHADAAALAIAYAQAASSDDRNRAWRALASSEAYRRLHERETAMGRAFTDSSFRAYLEVDSVRRRAAAMARALTRVAAGDWERAAERAMAYLPAGTQVHASVYLMWKPRPNSFVFDLERAPAIFLALDTTTTAAEWLNTASHELHHVGTAAACRARSSTYETPALRLAERWAGAFAEGVAMLAAAGGLDVHPHLASADSVRARWDRDMADASAQMRAVEAFLGDVLEARLTSPDSIAARGMTFFGTQGAWYTLGYRMASTVERADGRAGLLRYACDPFALMRRYQAVASGEPGAPLWSARLMRLLPAPVVPHGSPTGRGGA